MWLKVTQCAATTTLLSFPTSFLLDPTHARPGGEPSGRPAGSEAVPFSSRAPGFSASFCSAAGPGQHRCSRGWGGCPDAVPAEVSSKLLQRCTLSARLPGVKLRRAAVSTARLQSRGGLAPPSSPPSSLLPALLLAGSPSELTQLANPAESRFIYLFLGLGFCWILCRFFFIFFFLQESELNWLAKT